MLSAFHLRANSQASLELSQALSYLLLKTVSEREEAEITVSASQAPFPIPGPGTGVGGGGCWEERPSVCFISKLIKQSKKENLSNI